MGVPTSLSPASRSLETYRPPINGPKFRAQEQMDPALDRGWHWTHQAAFWPPAASSKPSTLVGNSSPRPWGRTVDLFPSTPSNSRSLLARSSGYGLGKGNRSPRFPLPFGCGKTYNCRLFPPAVFWDRCRFAAVGPDPLPSFAFRNSWFFRLFFLPKGGGGGLVPASPKK